MAPLSRLDIVLDLVFKFMQAVGRLWVDPLKRIALISGVLTVAVFILMSGPPYFSGAVVAPKTSLPMVDLELVETVEEVRLILGGGPSTDRETARLKTYQDFAFIAGYGPFLLVMGLLIARSGGWLRAAGYLLALCGVGAAGFDIAENRAILAILDLPINQTTQAMVDAIRRQAVIKWSLMAATVVVGIAVLAACMFHYAANDLKPQRSKSTAT